MDVLEKLHEIEERKCIYNIHYCKAGIGFCFYDEKKDTGNWREALVTEGYHKSLEEAIEAEYKKLKIKIEFSREDLEHRLSCIIKDYKSEIGWNEEWEQVINQIVAILKKKSPRNN